MNKIIFRFVPFVIFLLITPLNAERIKLAVLDLKPEKGTSVSTAERVTELLRSEMITRNFSVIDTSSMKKAADKQPALFSQCTKSSCAVKAGKLLSAKKVLAGSVKTVKRNIIITVEMFDVENEKADFQHSESIGRIRNIDSGIHQLAQHIINKVDKYITTAYGEKELTPSGKSDAGYQSKEPEGQNDSFAGTWNTTYGMLKIIKSEYNFNGSYYNGEASLTGAMTGNRLDFTWRESTGSGTGSFTLSADGNSFTGYWVAGASTKMEWNGVRVKQK